MTMCSSDSFFLWPFFFVGGEYTFRLIKWKYASLFGENMFQAHGAFAQQTLIVNKQGKKNCNSVEFVRRYDIFGIFV